VIRYRYAQHFNPPAPFVNVSVICPQTNRSAADIAAQIDSAADRTVLPGRVVRDLGLVEDGRLLFQGFAGDLVELPIYLVELHVHDLPPVALRAALGEHEPHILLGRDVLNLYRILLDGPQQALEIG
jgi:hypothetical protein